MIVLHPDAEYHICSLVMWFKDYGPASQPGGYLLTQAGETFVLYTGTLFRKCSW
jgi:hypothetical protein